MLHPNVFICCCSFLLTYAWYVQVWARCLLRHRCLGSHRSRAAPQNPGRPWPRPSWEEGIFQTAAATWQKIQWQPWPIFSLRPMQAWSLLTGGVCWRGPAPSTPKDSSEDSAGGVSGHGQVPTRILGTAPRGWPAKQVRGQDKFWDIH